MVIRVFKTACIMGKEGIDRALQRLAACVDLDSCTVFVANGWICAIHELCDGYLETYRINIFTPEREPWIPRPTKLFENSVPQLIDNC